MSKRNLKELDAQDKLCVEAYLSNGLDRKKAIMASGRKCKESSAHELAYRFFKRTEIKTYIDERLKETILSTNQVLAGISDLAEAADLQRDRLKAYELLGKHLKLFTEQSEININVSELSDDKLAALARG